ncbi:MAG TPA: DNA polymerase IV [Thermomicrobiales bacterium]|nr:DNA polymerase IV [Thermomicrobiales bacterium]
MYGHDADRWVIHADLDAFFAAAEVLRRPELRGRPVIVGGSPEGRGVVASATYEARQLGVRSAMPMAQAIRLCPQAVIVRPDGAFYRELSQRFRIVLDDFSPLVEVVSIDEAYLDVSNSERLFGSVEQLAQALKNRVHDEVGLAVSLGVASNKLVAKIASDLDKPDGLRIVPHGQEAATLGPLPVERLPGIGPKASARLRGAGIATLARLAAAPEVLLLDIAGNDAARLRARARGEDDRPVRAEPDERKSLGHERTFDHDVVARAELDTALYQLCERTGAELRRRGLTATTVALKLRYDDFSTVTRQQSFERPTDAHQDVFTIAAGLLDRTLAERRAPVRLLGVRVASLAAASHQLDLFDDHRARLRQLNAAIDRIAERTGAPVIVPARFARAPARREAEIDGKERR